MYRTDSLDDLRHFRANCLELGTPILFDSRQEAHDEMLDVIHEVMTELQSEGVKIPNAKQFLADSARLWSLWQHFAPSPN